MRHLRTITSVIALLSACLATLPQAAAQSAQTLVVLPFENASKAPGLEWIGEAFPEVLGQRLASTSLYVVGREDRLYAFDRLGIPANLRPSRATLFRIAEQMDVDYMVLGEYSFDGSRFTAKSQLLDLKRLHLSPELSESGPLPKLLEVENALAWQLLRTLRPGLEVSRENFLAMSPAIRLDALENYIRGVVATEHRDKLRYFREALRLNPNYTLATFQIAKTYFAARDYDSAANWFARLPKNDPVAREGNFYLGLSAYYVGEFERAANAFKFLASRLPLTEVHNNLGVMEARRGRKDALEYFEKAVQADPNDADYRFNLALAFYRNGEPGAAAAQLREALKLRPGDAEARSLAESIGSVQRTQAGAQRLPLERIKRNYDETSFRQLALEIQNATEMRLAKTDPRTHAAYHVEHGRELLSQGFVVEAAQELHEAIWLDPTNAGAHVALGLALEASNDYAAARNEARTAVRLQPLAEAYLLLARIDLKENNAEGAQESVNRALALEPGNVAAQNLRTTVAAKLAEKAQPQAR